jgi:membrane-associated protein
LLVLAASLSDICGYWIGRKAGPAISNREDSRLFRREHVDRTRAFFDKHGARAVLLGRFVPIVRTFVTVTAGVAGMNARSYLIHSVLGAIVWAAGVTLLGRWLGGFSFAADNIELVLLGVVGLSLAPIAVEYTKASRTPHQPENG